MSEFCKSLPEELRAKILESRSVAIWPLDENPLSESYQQARYLQDQGFRIYPINDHAERILEERCLRDIRLIPYDYDILLLFVPSSKLPEVVNAIFQADYTPPVVWTHTGIYDQQSFDRLTDAGILTVMDEDFVAVYKKLLGS